MGLFFIVNLLFWDKKKTLPLCKENWKLLQMFPEFYNTLQTDFYTHDTDGQIEQTYVYRLFQLTSQT